MAYGLSVSNSSGIIQIDQDYANYGLVAESSVWVTGRVNTSTGSDNPGNSTYVYFADTGTLPIICVQTPPNGGYIQLVSISTTSASFRIFSDTRQYYGPVGVDGAVFYRVYGPMNKIIAETKYGLVVKRPDGSTAFNSNIRSMNILGNVQFSNPSGWDTYPSVETGIGGNPYFHINSTLYEISYEVAGFSDGTTAPIARYSPILRHSGTTLQPGIGMIQGDAAYAGGRGLQIRLPVFYVK
jgi:hypothetical protein